MGTVAAGRGDSCHRTRAPVAENALEERAQVARGSRGGDLLLFSIACSTGFVTGRGVPLLPVASDAASLGTGRFAIYDPLVDNLPGLIKVGETDLNVLTHHSSVQGYGSAVDEVYNDVTGAHLDGTFSPAHWKRVHSVLSGLRTVLAIPGSVAPQDQRAFRRHPGRPAAASTGRPADATSRTWLFETDEEIDRASCRSRLAPWSARSRPEACGSGSSTPTGAVTWPAIESSSQTSSGIKSCNSPGPWTATGLVVSGQGAGEIADTSTVSGPAVTPGSRRAVAGRARRGGWRYAGRVAGFARYTLDVPAPTVWIEGGGAGASVSRLSTTDRGRRDRLRGLPIDRSSSSEVRRSPRAGM